MEEKIINEKIFRLVAIRGRAKWIAKDGTAYNPVKFNQPASIHINPDGYPCFGGGIPVHLYVAYAWVDGYFEGAEVDHIDYNRYNYNYQNLRWVTHLENIHHSSDEGNRYKNTHCGEINGRATLTTSDVLRIRELFSQGLSTTDVIKIMHPGLSYSERKALWNKYNRIKTYQTWNNI